ncbi:hypothetical protein F0562_024152 [Nyssa sinensis]|uniref:LOB domain-containing protein n=1 Tax=Nyssa sinensis TaxID=561372 RepID=A0A5J5BAR9_9ASTE|nr:hypothetical protein F0562_024152 [Nyssa sinensis]
MSINPRANGTQACAACKYQRRKCAADCILAPYFPHDRQRQFLNAHKLFGVSNITKIIRNLDQPKKDAAMRTIIFQSDVRASDPVGGCYRIICELQRQIEYSVAELNIVLRQLDLYKAQAHQQPQIQMPADDSDIINPDPLNSYNPMNYHQLQPQPHQDQCIMQYNQVPLQDISSWSTMQDSALSPSQDHEKESFFNECDDFRPPLDTPLQIHEYRRFEPEETIEQSEEDILKDEKGILRDENDYSIQHAQDHDLKSAATLFSLTNCTG